MLVVSFYISLINLRILSYDNLFLLLGLPSPQGVLILKHSNQILNNTKIENIICVHNHYITSLICSLEAVLQFCFT